MSFTPVLFDGSSVSVPVLSATSPFWPYNPPFAGGAVSGVITPSRNNGEFQQFSFIGATTLNPPTHGYIGSKLLFWVTPTGTNQTFVLGSGILIPTDSTFSGTKTLTANKTYIIQLQHNGAAWMLTSLVGGY